MNRTDAIAFLTRCADDNGVHWYQGRPWDDVATCPTCHGSNDAGHLDAPCSRYGRTAADIAPFVWRVALIDGNTDEHNLDYLMGLCVNDSESPQNMFREYVVGLSGADVDAMVEGYLTCQLWAGLDYDHAVDGEPVNYDENYDVTDVDTDYIEGLREEFAALVVAHPLAVRMYLNTWGRYEGARRQYDRNELFGHDFYLTREGHGAGFWDRGLGDLGDYLTKIAEDAGSADDLSDNGNGVLVK